MQHAKEIIIDEKEYEEVIENYKISTIKDMEWDDLEPELFEVVCAGKYGWDIVDKDNISLLMHLMMQRIQVPTIKNILEKSDVDINITDVKGNTLVYWFKKNFYEFEKEYAEIALLLKQNGADIDFSKETMKFDNFIVNDWKEIPYNMQLKVAKDPYLYMNVVDSAYGQTVIMYWLRTAPACPYDFILINTILNNEKLSQKQDSNGNTLAHCVYENYYYYATECTQILNNIKKSSLFTSINNNGKNPFQVIPPIKIPLWENLKPHILKYLLVHPTLLIALNKTITVDQTYGETYICYAHLINKIRQHHSYSKTKLSYQIS